jgi:hypothetical protein
LRKRVEGCQRERRFYFIGRCPGSEPRVGEYLRNLQALRYIFLQYIFNKVARLWKGKKYKRKVHTLKQSLTERKPNWVLEMPEYNFRTHYCIVIIIKR